MCGICVHTCKHTHIRVKVRGQPQVPQESFTECLSLGPGLSPQARLTGQKAARIHLFLCHGYWVTCAHRHTWLFKLILGMELEPSCLHSKHLTMSCLLTIFHLCLALPSCPVFLIVIICFWLHSCCPSRHCCPVGHFCCLKSVF